ncbi:MAG: hypothetical protein AB8H47_14995 [Bacteroidia bacterium]
MNIRFMPIILMLTVAALVYGLTYHAEHRQKPQPSYDFYQPAVVWIIAEDSSAELEVYGQYQNILQGKREYVESAKIQAGQWRMDFSVNSPRPATLYINDQAVEVFLVPGDSTSEMILRLDSLDRPNNIRFAGDNAKICRYLRKKYKRFKQVQVRSNRKLIAETEFEIYTAKLDSMAAHELAFLTEQEVFTTLPEWFVKFEKNDILYQKAFLKRSQAYNRDVDTSLFDQVLINNQSAMFSHHYYLYLNIYLQELVGIPPNPPPADNPNYEAWHRSCLQIADEQLLAGPKDVYMTREIFGMLLDSKFVFAQEMLKKYEGHFTSKKYFRFLQLQLEIRQKSAQTQPEAA